MKSNYIKDLEKKYSNINYSANVIPDQKKYFITFPYPYMNGKLHLGHAYTVVHADFTARYKRQRGYNVLFPFAYHGTGMPIYACAQKLKYELEKYAEPNEWSILPNTTQIKILSDMGIPLNLVSNFTDPYYWLEYFPTHAQKDLIKLSISSDFSRSFVTTDINFYYDSFIKWQFSKLDEKNLITKGLRYVIYSEKDKQPCADHDRQTGEGIEPIEYKMNTQYVTIYNNKQIIFFATLLSTSTDNLKIYMNPKETYQLFELNSLTYVASEKSISNIKHQYSIKIVDNIDANNIKNISFTSKNCATGIYLSTDINNEYPIIVSESNPNTLRYLEPQSHVLSRTGDNCVVALTDQYYINYGDEQLKNKVNNFIEHNFKNTDKKTIELLKHASNWIKEWPYSRHYGLGTKYNEQLIDSLSDSTIYMEYYTVAHLIDNLPKEKINNSLWDAIFLNKELNNTLYSTNELNVINNMKTEFNYW